KWGVQARLVLPGHDESADACLPRPSDVLRNHVGISAVVGAKQRKVGFGSIPAPRTEPDVVVGEDGHAPRVEDRWPRRHWLGLTPCAYVGGTPKAHNQHERHDERREDHAVARLTVSGTHRLGLV